MPSVWRLGSDLGLGPLEVFREPGIGVLGDELGFLGCRVAADDFVAVGEAAELLDHLQVLDGAGDGTLFLLVLGKRAP